MTYTKSEITEAKERLLKYDWQTDGLLIVINSVSRSGMTRRMAVYSMKDHDYLTYSVARALNWSMNDDGIKVGGCGMDMCFHLADTLTWALFGEARYQLSKDGKLPGNGGSCINWKVLG